jgi:hypothetical protein|tara:strand:+ start:1191 stop:1943 length:753 start_codon:yes stop_codon:yes gene_type:complete
MIETTTHLDEYRSVLVNHPLYNKIDSIDAIRLFMETHVFAVWDFMSLLKRLQLELTCASVPWIPVGNPVTRRLINEIVFGEESDVDQNGQAVSHFELYIRAMEDIGADTIAITSFIKQIKQGKSWENALLTSGASQAAIQFVRNTMACVEHAPVHVVAGVFTYGREDLIPDMFISIVRELSEKGQSGAQTLVYYLERHIEIDGDEHGPMALQMIEELCEGDSIKKQESIHAAKQALKSRTELWDAIADTL